MAKYYLRLGNTEIPRVSQLTVNFFYRAETKQTTLSGGLAVDRGDLKKRIEATVKIMTAEEFENLENILASIVVTAEFYHLNKLATINAVCNPVQSKEEILLYGQREKGVYYANVKFVLEEQ